MRRRWLIPVVCLMAGLAVGSFVAGPVLLGQNRTTSAPATAPAVTGIPKELASYHPVVKTMLPAVVSIESKVRPKVGKKGPATRRAPEFGDLPPGVPDELRRFFEDRQMPDDETPHVGFGSGFIVDPKGVILTNNHVVGGADEVEVTLQDGRQFTSKDIHTDPKTDLAIVRIDAKAQLPYLQLGDSDAMEIGDRVLAVGAPFGLTGSVTAGIISAKGRNLQMNMYEDFLQTDAAINPGNSGGPLVNLEGRVIGINAAIKSRTGGFQGVGMAISSNLAKNVMEQLLTSGVVHRGYLGVQIQDLRPDVADRLGLKDKQGVIVGQVFDNSPAAKAGIKEGDVILDLGGKSIKNGHDLQRMVAGLPQGKPADVTVWRDGKTQDLSVTIQEQPKEFGNEGEVAPPSRSRSKESISLDRVGVEVSDLTPEAAEELGYKEAGAGALVTRIQPDSPAADAGLTRGMLIVKADRKPVNSAGDFQKLVEKADLQKGVLLQVRTSRGRSSFLVLKATSKE